MRRHIVIVSGLQIIDNPRVVKEADAFAELGYEVTVLAAIHSPASLPRIEAIMRGRSWKHLPEINLAQRTFSSLLSHNALRAATRLSRVVKASFDWETPLQLGSTTLPLWWAVSKFDADLYSLHLEKALWVGERLLDAGRPVRIDIEDWHSEDGLPEDGAKRPLRLIRAAEKRLLNNAVHSTATSEAMVDALVAAYRCPRPEVIHNSFPIAERSQIDGRRLGRSIRAGPSITWFSQTIGPGRGLEALVAAFEQMPSQAELHLRGTPRPAYVAQLLDRISPDVKARVKIHPQVPQGEFLSRLAEHDIGYCGELSDCRNRDVTITNKVFEYMRARLAIVASDTAGQREVAARAPDAVRLFAQGNDQDLARALRPLIDDASLRDAAKSASLQALIDHFSWERSKQRLQNQVSGYFGETC